MDYHTRYDRNTSGTVVHKALCPVKGNRVQWVWAQTFDSDEDLVRALPAWVKPCGRCLGQAMRANGGS